MSFSGKVLVDATLHGNFLVNLLFRRLAFVVCGFALTAAS